MHQALRDAQITFEYQHYLPFRGWVGVGDGPRLRGLCPGDPVLLEVDEGAQGLRPQLRRAPELRHGGHKLLVLRYNPDAKKERHAQLSRPSRKRRSPASFSSTTGTRRTARPCVAEHWSEPVRAARASSPETKRLAFN